MSFSETGGLFGPGHGDDPRARYDQADADAAMERDELLGAYRQAALELHAEIRQLVAWNAAGGEPAVAEHRAVKTADKWLPLLDQDAA